jgi:G:T-mismatch repair DNA endonuclease (very short patch repair protein)
MVFTRTRVAVFLDGCFWHGCPDHHRPSRQNEEFWREKIARNRQRDAETDKLLEEAGWTVVRIWEHEELELAALRVRKTVSMKRDRPELSSRSPASPWLPDRPAELGVRFGRIRPCQRLSPRLA